MSNSILGSGWITDFTGLPEGFYQNGIDIGSKSYIKPPPTITATLIENTTIINGLLSGSSITPYAIYDASLYNSTYNVLPEARGQTTKNVTNTVGTITKGSYSANTFGATASIPYISGGTGAKLIFPTGSMPSTFTIFAISRYTNVLTNKNRILTTDTGDWFLGHELGKVGVAKFGGPSYKTDVNGVTVSSSANWLVIGANNALSGTALNTVYSNNTPNGTALGGNGGYNLGINTFAGQESEWALSYLIIYETALSNANMATVSQKLTDYLTNGSFVTVAPYVTNGDFSNPVVTTDTYSYNPATIPFWTKSDSTINRAICNGNCGFQCATLPSQQYMAFQNYNTIGTISIYQTLTLPVGDYILTFYSWPRPQWFNPSISLRVYIGTTNLTPTPITYTAGADATLTTRPFTISTAGNYNLKFSSVNSVYNDTTICFTKIAVVRA